MADGGASRTGRPDLPELQAGPIPEAVLERARGIRLLGLDVDGVMTDGRLYYGTDGTEFKAFHVQDGSAMKMLLAAGMPIAIVTGRTSEAVDRRAEELGVPYLYTGIDDKLGVLEELCAKSGVVPGQMAYAGDDLGDLPLFDRVGMSFSVPDAHPAVTRRADYVTAARGGFGAVREICNLLLAARQ